MRVRLPTPHLLYSTFVTRESPGRLPSDRYVKRSFLKFYPRMPILYQIPTLPVKEKVEESYFAHCS